MKYLFLSMLIIFSQSSLGAAKKKPVKKVIIEDKVYVVVKNSPEIIIGEQVKEDKIKVPTFQRPNELWYGALVRSNMNYRLPTLTSNSTSFSPAFVGLVFGKKLQNQFGLYKGYYEVSGEWQKFERNSFYGNGSIFSQKLNLYQLNLFQNFNVFWALKHSVLFSLGVGAAPVYLTTEQSVFGNSTSELGYLGMLKANLVVPIKKKYEIDCAFKFGWGVVGGRNLYTQALSLGLNFE